MEWGGIKQTHTVLRGDGDRICFQRHHVETENSVSGHFPSPQFNRALTGAIASSQSPTGDSAMQSTAEKIVNPGRWDIPPAPQEGREEDSETIQIFEILRLASNQPAFAARFLSGQAGAVHEPRVCVQMQ